MVLQTIFWLAALRQDCQLWRPAPFHRTRSRPRRSRLGSRRAAAARPLRRPGSGPRRGFRVPHARATIGVGAVSTPGTTVLTLDRSRSPASVRRVLNGMSLHPATTIHPCGALLDEASTRGSNDFSRPIFPSPDPVGWNDSVLGLDPELRTPRLLAAHVGVGTGHRARTSINALRHKTQPPIQR
jgi:hypothetical protein